MLLKGPHIQLRAPEPEDLDLLYDWENKPEVWTISNTMNPFSRYLLRQYIENAHQDIYTARQLRLMIQIQKTYETIGTIDLFDFEPAHRRAGVGILIAQENQRRKGYASEALQLVKDYAFSVLDLHQLFCNVSSENEASLNLFEKFGFQRIGVKKDWIRVNNSFKDEFLLQCIR